MKLQFGLLWIEDNSSPQEDAEIRTSAAEAGFELDVTISKDGSDVNELADQQKKFHLFDLILLDLNLAGGIKGDKLAATVRQLFRSTPILFYSGSDSEAGLRNRMANDRIEGVFCADRGNFTRRAGELVRDYAQTLNRLSGMRGLAMEVVAEVDAICRSVILSIATGGLEVDAISHLDSAVAEQASKNLTDYPKLFDLTARMHHPATDSMKAFGLFREVLRKHVASLPAGNPKDRLLALTLETRDYRTKVIGVRNVLGHALEERNDLGWSILDRDGNAYMTVADFPRVRSDFLGNLRAMRQIVDILVPKKGG